ncbi:MAG: mycofactocin biosynthesis chaperone MftB [Acidimicrobiales bacterium]
MLDHPYELHPKVSLRPEPFGALAYHFGNRRLSFLRSPDMVTVVNSLADHPTAADALTAAGIASTRWPSFETALAALESSEMIRVRD